MVLARVAVGRSGLPEELQLSFVHNLYRPVSGHCGRTGTGDSVFDVKNFSPPVRNHECMSTESRFSDSGEDKWSH